MRSTQFFLLAAVAGIAHAQTTTTSSDSAASSSYLAAESSILAKMEAFDTMSEDSAWQSDVVSWQQGWLSTQTVLPTDYPQDAPTNHELENAFEVNYVQGMLDLMAKKVYLNNAAEQSSVVEVMKEYQTLLRGAAGTYVSQPTETAKSETTAAGAEEEKQDEEKKDEEKKDEDSAAGRVGGVGALAAVLVSGLLVVMAL